MVTREELGQAAGILGMGAVFWLWLGLAWSWTAGAVAFWMMFALAIYALVLMVNAPRPVDVDPYGPNTVAIYRLVNRQGALLYVGITDNPKRRFKEHAKDKQWWPQVAAWTVEWLPDRDAALDAEARAIAYEVPAFNLASVPDDWKPWDAAFGQHEREFFDKVPPDLHTLNRLYLHVRHGSSLDDRYQPRLKWPRDAVWQTYCHAKAKAGDWTKSRHEWFVERWDRERDPVRRMAEALPGERQMLRSLPAWKDRRG